MLTARNVSNSHSKRNSTRAHRGVRHLQQAKESRMRLVPLGCIHREFDDSSRFGVVMEDDRASGLQEEEEEEEE
jgi:hypothetical protein